jgi:hypothetical protein
MNLNELMGPLFDAVHWKYEFDNTKKKLMKDICFLYIPSGTVMRLSFQ